MQRCFSFTMTGSVDVTPDKPAQEPWKESRHEEPESKSCCEKVTGAPGSRPMLGANLGIA